MASGNPRKFSEKIAIMERKANEDTRAFEAVMGEVREVTRVPDVPFGAQLGVPAGSWPRPGGSLPDVHAVVQRPDVSPGAAGVPVDAAGRWGARWSDEPERQHRIFRHRSPGAPTHSHFHPYNRSQMAAPHASFAPGSYDPTRFGGGGAPLAPFAYAAGPYVGVGPNSLLVPDPNWRRTHSDPGINSSVMQPASVSGSAASSPLTPNQQSPHDHSPPGGNSPFTDSSPQGGISPIYCDAKGAAMTDMELSKPIACQTIPNQSNPTGIANSLPISIPGPGGSLPDLPSPLRNCLPPTGWAPPVGSLEASARGADFGALPSYGMATGGGGGQQVLQQRHSIQLPLPPGVVPPPRMNNPYNLMAATPPYSSVGSQSAPNSPSSAESGAQPPTPASMQYYDLQAQMSNINMVRDRRAFVERVAVQESDSPGQQQQHSMTADFLNQQQMLGAFGNMYGLSVDSDAMARLMPGNGQIPDIVLSGAPYAGEDLWSEPGMSAGPTGEASLNNGPMSATPSQPLDSPFEYFSDLQNLDTSELQQLLRSGDQVDAASEDALRLAD